MNEKTQMSGSIYSFLPTDIDGFDSLAELALDMRWSWNHSADYLWRQLDPVLWQLTHNPWVVLQTVAREKLGAMLADPAFRSQIDALVQSKRRWPRLQRGFNNIIHSPR